MAHRLQQISSSNSSLKIALLEARNPPPTPALHPSLSDDTTNDGTPADGIPEARAYALSPSSLSILGLDTDTSTNSDSSTTTTTTSLPKILQAAPYATMQIWEANGPGNLRFSAQDLEHHSSTSVSSQQRLGAVIEDSRLVSYLWESIRQKNNQHVNQPNGTTHNHTFATTTTVDCLSNSVIDDITFPDNKSSPIELRLKSRDNKNDSTSNSDSNNNTHSSIRARLLIAADGANSQIVKRLQVPQTKRSYDRQSIICTVSLQHRPGLKRNVAYQKFVRGGPIALLPTWGGIPVNSGSSASGNAGNNEDFYGNIVWSTTPTKAARLLALPSPRFLEELNRELQNGPTSSQPSGLPLLDSLVKFAGEGLALKAWNEPNGAFSTPPVISDLVSKRYGPMELKLSQCHTYHPHPRVALIGDAGHTFHPMAGQGLNLGLSDVESLCANLQKAQTGGMELNTFLQEWDRERLVESTAIMGGIQVLHGFFSVAGNQELPAALELPIGWVRSLGMNGIQSLGVVRKGLARLAAGVGPRV
eukprot:CAMPEP_0194371984 /NCGR_PEP_ID=MMETSP0174-20130528/20296_1 /TAXON_ID=216777 /ORGANISM="Proboscia alata, Strain PI-D3" /LENGTH=530 /DNA_ID=CAMNT_0039150237 /DNA_START=257 /DNA_END=1849 /DNA_ORIENTATION=+